MSKLAAVFQIGSLGDSIVSVPTLLSLRELIPDCSEYLLVSRFDTKAKVVPAEIFEMAWKPSRLINYTNPERRLASLITVPALLAKLRYYRPRYAVSLMPSDREPQRVERDIKFFKAGGIKDLLGFRVMPPGPSYPAAPIDISGTEAFRKFERAWGSPARLKFPDYTRVPILRPPQEAERRVAQWLASNRRHPDKRLIALAPYSNYSSRDVPDHTIQEILRRVTAEEDAEVVLIGGGKDTARATAMLAKAGAGLNACGVFSVPESTALLKACALAICTESGPMHLGAAVGTPLLAIFSRITKRLAQWLPFGDRLTILYREVPCAGCDSMLCPVAGHPCMELIGADQVISSAHRILRGEAVEESTLNGTKVFTWPQLV